MENKRLFQQYYSRLAKEGIAKALILGFIVGFSVSFILAFISFLLKYNGLWLSIGMGFAAVIATTPLFYHFLFRPKIKQIAEQIDRLGLEERLITMMELENDKSYIAERQREDAKEKLSEVLRKRIKQHSIFRLFRIPIVLMLVLAVSASAMVTVSAVSFKNLISEPHAEDIYLEINYLAESGGYIDGEAHQSVIFGQDALTVVAVADNGRIFLQWSDGVTTAERTDRDVQKDISISALFAILEEEVPLALPKIPDAYAHLEEILLFLIESKKNIDCFSIIALGIDSRTNKVNVHMLDENRIDEIVVLLQINKFDINLVYFDTKPNGFSRQNIDWPYKSYSICEYLCVYFLNPCKEFPDEFNEHILWTHWNASHLHDCEIILWGYLFPCQPFHPFSLTYLREIQFVLSEYWSTQSRLGDCGIIEIEIDESINRVVVRLSDESKIKCIINFLKENNYGKVFDADAVQFEICFATEYLYAVYNFLLGFSNDYNIIDTYVNENEHRVIVVLYDVNNMDDINQLLELYGFSPKSVNYFIDVTLRDPLLQNCPGYLIHSYYARIDNN